MVFFRKYLFLILSVLTLEGCNENDNDSQLPIQVKIKILDSGGSSLSVNSITWYEINNTEDQFFEKCEDDADLCSEFSIFVPNNEGIYIWSSVPLSSDDGVCTVMHSGEDYFSADESTVTVNLTLYPQWVTCR